jgi:hypothetical protein
MSYIKDDIMKLEKKYSSLAIEAIKQYNNAKCMAYDPIANTLTLSKNGITISDTDIKIPDDETLAQLVSKLQISKKQEELLKNITSYYRNQVKKLKHSIAGVEVTQEQLEEYQAKKEAVDNNDVAYFEEEAKLLNTTAQEVFNAVKQMAAAWQQEFKQGLAKLGAVRIKLKKYVNNQELDLVEFILKDIPKQDIISLDLTEYFTVTVVNKYNTYVAEQETLRQQEEEAQQQAESTPTTDVESSEV